MIPTNTNANQFLEPTQPPPPVDEEPFTHDEGRPSYELVHDMESDDDLGQVVKQTVEPVEVKFAKGMFSLTFFSLYYLWLLLDSSFLKPFCFHLSSPHSFPFI